MEPSGIIFTAGDDCRRKIVGHHTVECRMGTALVVTVTQAKDHKLFLPNVKIL